MGDQENQNVLTHLLGKNQMYRSRYLAKNLKILKSLPRILRNHPMSRNNRGTLSHRLLNHLNKSHQRLKNQFNLL